ncbi:hypothetical protein [Streptomyces sp. NPDC048638]|uniref:hypothetical protein n=1 Tax=Streptomyces sp. NPDC048638 TaxID=3365580 RepID=UPI00371076C6
MPDEERPDGPPEDGQPADTSGSARAVAREVLRMIAVLGPITLGAIGLVALALGMVGLFLYVLYRELGLLGAVATIVLTVSVLRLLTLYSQSRTRPRP